MDANVFMQLLVTQLKNQNPSAPMDTNQMMSRPLQLAMMEKMTELTTNSRRASPSRCGMAAAQPDRPHGGLHLAGRHHRDRRRQSVSYAGSVPARQGSADRAPFASTPITRRSPAPRRLLTSLFTLRKAVTMLRSLYSGISGLRAAPDHAGRHRQQHRQRQHDRLQAPAPSVPGHPVADVTAPARRRPRPAAPTRPRSASACASPASPPTSRQGAAQSHRPSHRHDDQR